MINQIQKGATKREKRMKSKINILLIRYKTKLNHKIKRQNKNKNKKRKKQKTKNSTTPGFEPLWGPAQVPAANSRSASRWLSFARLTSS